MALDNTKILALFNLLADSDEEVVKIASNALLNYGAEVLPLLEESYFLIESDYQKRLVDEIIEKLKLASIEQRLLLWKASKAKDLFEAWCIISEISGRVIDKAAIVKEMEQIKIDIWLGLQPDQSVVEKINFFNHIFFDKHRFEGDSKDYSSPNNTFVDSVINNRKGNPISLSCIYLIIAQKLKLPVYGVNLPQHFVLAFLNLEIGLLKEHDIQGLIDGDDVPLPVNVNSEPLFYINPFNKGTIFSKSHLFAFFMQLKIKPEKKHYSICNEEKIVSRMLRNLQLSYANSNNEIKVNTINHLLNLFYD